MVVLAGQLLLLLLRGLLLLVSVRVMGFLAVQLQQQLGLAQQVMVMGCLAVMPAQVTVWGRGLLAV
jgi:hypothetical protein